MAVNCNISKTIAEYINTKRYGLTYKNSLLKDFAAEYLNSLNCEEVSLCVITSEPCSNLEEKICTLDANVTVEPYFIGGSSPYYAFKFPYSISGTELPLISKSFTYDTLIFENISTDPEYLLLRFKSQWLYTAAYHTSRIRFQCTDGECTVDKTWDFSYTRSTGTLYMSAVLPLKVCKNVADPVATINDDGTTRITFDNDNQITDINITELVEAGDTPEVYNYYAVIGTYIDVDLPPNSYLITLTHHCATYNVITKGLIHLIEPTIAPPIFGPPVVGTTSFTVSWEDIGSEGYQVALQTTDTEPQSGTLTQSNIYTNNALTPGTDYFLFVRYVLPDDIQPSNNFSDWSLIDFTTNSLPTCSNITNITYTLGTYNPITNKFPVTISWTPVGEAGSYQVTGTFSGVIPGNSFIFELSPGTNYSGTIRANCAAIQSAAANYSGSTPALTLPTAPVVQFMKDEITVLSKRYVNTFFKVDPTVTSVRIEIGVLIDDTLPEGWISNSGLITPGTSPTATGSTPIGFDSRSIWHNAQVLNQGYNIDETSRLKIRVTLYNSVGNSVFTYFGGGNNVISAITHLNADQSKIYEYFPMEDNLLPTMTVQFAGNQQANTTTITLVPTGSYPYGISNCEEAIISVMDEDGVITNYVLNTPTNQKVINNLAVGKYLIQACYIISTSCNDLEKYISVKPQLLTI